MPPRAIWSSVNVTIASGSGCAPAAARPAAAVLVEQEDEVDRLGELGPLGVRGVEAEAAVLGVELLGELGLALRDRRPATERGLVRRRPP